MLDLGRFPYIDAAGKAVDKVALTDGDTLTLDVKFNNTTDKNITLELTGATPADSATYTVVDNSDGSIVKSATNIQSVAADVAILKGKSVTLGTISEAGLAVGSYTVIVEIVDGTTTYDSEIVVTVNAKKADADAAAAVVTEINALGSNPTKAAVLAISNGSTGSYDVLSTEAKALVTNYAKLKAFTDDIAAGVSAKGTISALGADYTNKAVADARAEYEALGALGKAEVDNLAALTAAETALADAKTALANKIASAEVLYNAQKARVDSFTAAEIDSINNGTTSGAFTTYYNKVAQLKADITTAKGVAVNADTTKLSDITGAKTTLDTAVDTTFAGAKTAFDTNTDVVAIGK